MMRRPTWVPLRAYFLARYEAGAKPIAMVSTDNFSENGKRYENGILTIAKGWAKHGRHPRLHRLSDRS